MIRMRHVIIESQYPLSFRQDDATALGKHLKNRHSVVLIGMKRVGISNFLRFFLYHKDVVSTYIDKKEKHLFIPVDLNDLVEREIFPFWVLTFKRIVDATEKADLPEKIKATIEMLFLDSIQSKDLFLLIDGVRKSLVLLVEHGVLPTLFFIRFDRIKDAITQELYANLQGLRDATHEKVSYVFTGVRSLDFLAPAVFTKSSLSMFAYDIYLRPAKSHDIQVIFETYKKQYGLTLSPALQKSLFRYVDGYIQYLQLALIALREQRVLPKDENALFPLLIKDERISLQSEEVWESLIEEEQEVLLKMASMGKMTKEERSKTKYLWDTGLVTEKTVFSPLFEAYLTYQQEKRKMEINGKEFSKKENQLFTLLKAHLNEICERELIIETVWPEVEAVGGVSDWAIDRLVARVRSKLRAQKAAYEIQTVKTRGYKLLEKASRE